MANIRIDLQAPVIDGQSLIFKSPADCSQITGLSVYYPVNDSLASITFQFADAHGNNVGSVSLFAENVMVKVILDTELKRAYVQNADTNSYIENTFLKKEDFNDWFAKGEALPENADLNSYTTEGKYYGQDIVSTLKNCPTDRNFALFVFARTYTSSKSQMIIDMTGRLYTRSLTSSWGSWKEFSTTTELSSHTDSKANPHGVTASQVGLGNVPNVSTNDQTPTFTEASANAKLSSGEKLSVAFGKIAKAISSLISHLANKSNPHGVTTSQIGAVAKSEFIDWFNTGVEIPSNSDLNSYTEPGKYYAKSGSIAKTLVNKPEKLVDNFAMYVFRRTVSGAIIQLIFSINGDIIVRGTGEDGGYRDWKWKVDTTTLTAHTSDESNPHKVTATQVGAVPTSRTVNGKALSSNISLSASDVSARPNTWTPTASDVGAVPTTRKVNNKALSEDITLSASDVGAAPSSHTSNQENPHGVTAAQVGAVPTSRTVNGKALSGNISLSASDVSAVPTSRTVNGKKLSSNISLSATDVGARPNTWTPTASDVGALPKTGGELTGSLNIRKSNPSLALTDTSDTASAFVQIIGELLALGYDTTNSLQIAKDGSVSMFGSRPNHNGNSLALKSEVDGVDWLKVGTSIPAKSNLNSYTTPGKYYCTEANSANLTNSPVTNDGFTMFVFGRQSKSVTQLIIGYAGGLYTRSSTTSGSFSKAWVKYANQSTVLNAKESTESPGCFYRTVDGVEEWYNPPMINGYEYRTTERYLGKPVYTVSKYLGALPNNSSKEMYFGFSSEVVVRADFWVVDPSKHLFPLSDLTKAEWYYRTGESNYIKVTTSADLSVQTLYAQIWYTKEAV